MALAFAIDKSYSRTQCKLFTNSSHLAVISTQMNKLFRFNRLTSLISLLAISPLAAFSTLAQTDDYNINIADLLMDFSVFVEYTYNDNVTAIPDDAVDRFDPSIVGPRSDYSLGFGADVGIDWQLTDNNTLGLVFGFRALDYQDLNYLDSERTFFSIAPESEIDFSILLGSFEFRIYDRFGYTVDGSNSVLVDRVAQDEGGPVVDPDGRPIIEGRSVSFAVDRYAAWENEIGLEGIAFLNPVEWTIRISRYDLMPDDNDGGEFIEELGRALEDDRWEFTRRREWIINTQVYYPLGRDNGFGVYGQYTSNDYKRDILTDSDGWQIGATVDWALGDRTALSATVGYDVREYDEANILRFANGNIAYILEGKNWFYTVEILNLLGETFNHKLSFTRQISYGRATNEQLSSIIAYDFLYEGIRNVDFTGGFQWLTAEDSGPAPFAEDYDLFLARLGLDIELTESLNSKLSYQYVDKDSDNNDRDFEQSRASVSLHYDF